MNFKIRKERRRNIYMKFTNLLLTKLSKKKERSEGIYFEILHQIKKALKKNPLEILEFCLKKLEPPLKTKKKKIAGQVYPLPSFLHKEGRLYFAINYLLEAVKQNRNKETDIAQTIAGEIINVHLENSIALKYKQDLVEKLEENRPFLRLPKKKFFLRRRRKLRIPKYRVRDKKDQLISKSTNNYKKYVYQKRKDKKTILSPNKKKWKSSRKYSITSSRRRSEKEIPLSRF
jgi:ribosomal protein S7